MPPYLGMEISRAAVRDNGGGRPFCASVKHQHLIFTRTLLLLAQAKENFDSADKCVCPCSFFYTDMNKENSFFICAFPFSFPVHQHALRLCPLSRPSNRVQPSLSRNVTRPVLCMCIASTRVAFAFTFTSYTQIRRHPSRHR